MMKFEIKGREYAGEEERYDNDIRLKLPHEFHEDWMFCENMSDSEESCVAKGNSHVQGVEFDDGSDDS
ncbi:hypothetical protein PoB_005173200 [Plakobranchus ocellatus]|uniref:Uncharacterized protein n=1 Tax=Plakobranchus ocellatus TaxID=259542 RepID=A0AAV4C0V2_9GAST|nr:hypothetical protein PoB_005173200 [Plakobranchus ocellatus]